MRELQFDHIPAVARRIERDELATRVSVLEAELAKERANSAELMGQLSSAHEEVERLRSIIAERDADVDEGQAARARSEMHFAELATKFEQLQALEVDQRAEIANLRVTLAELQAANSATEEARAREKAAREEISACRALAEKCVFIIGFARSNTTITQQILNCAANSLILGEADFFLGDRGERFSDWYNEQHCEFENQITKSTHAPDFLPNTPHTWWQWLRCAAQFYDCVGEKIALSHYHGRKAQPDDFRAFYEARFLEARYIFMLRNPIDVLLSSAKLMRIVDDAGMAKLCAAWLDFMQLWADFIRVFPRTITIICEGFGEGSIKELEAFTGLELGDASLLLNPAHKRRHKLGSKFPTLVRLRPELEELYAVAVAAATENRAFWQAEQKRSAAANETTRATLGSIAMTARPLGRVWLRVRELRELMGYSKEVGS